MKRVGNFHFEAMTADEEMDMVFKLEPKEATEGGGGGGGGGGGKSRRDPVSRTPARRKSPF